MIAVSRPTKPPCGCSEVFEPYHPVQHYADLLDRAGFVLVLTYGPRCWSNRPPVWSAQILRGAVSAFDLPVAGETAEHAARAAYREAFKQGWLA